MHCIINPWVFYLLGISNSVEIMCVIFLMVFGVVFGTYLLFWIIEFIGDDVSFNELYEKYEIVEQEGEIYTIRERRKAGEDE